MSKPAEPTKINDIIHIEFEKAQFIIFYLFSIYRLNYPLSEVCLTLDNTAGWSEGGEACYRYIGYTGVYYVLPGEFTADERVS